MTAPIIQGWCRVGDQWFGNACVPARLRTCASEVWKDGDPSSQEINLTPCRIVGDPLFYVITGGASAELL